MRTPVVCRRLYLDRKGITALEYGIVAAFFCVGLVVIFSTFGTTVAALFLRATNAL